LKASRQSRAKFVSFYKY